MRKIPLLLALLASSALAREGVVNLLPNGGFEEKLSGWVFVDNSGRAGAEVDGKNRKEGKYSLHIAKTGGMPFDVLRGDIASVTPGSRVTVSALVMGKGVGNAFLKFWVYDKAGVSLVRDVDVKHLRGDFRWERIEKTYDLPSNAASAAVMLVMVMGGNLWLDDIRVEGKGARPGLDDRTKKWLDENAVKVASLRFDAPRDDLGPLKEILKDARIVQLGEMSHGDGPCFMAKARLVRFLYEELGFRVVAFEAGLFECDRANGLLAEGKVRDAMFASVPGIWRVEEVRPLFQYLSDRAATDRPLRLAGFDLQGSGSLVLEFPRELASFLDAEKVLAGGGGEAFRKAMNEIWEGKYRSSSASRKLVLAALDRLEKLLEERRAELEKEHGKTETDFIARCLENFRLWEASAIAPEKGKWEAINLRDARMAANLKWLADVRYPDEKIVTWGATFHLMHGAQRIREGRKKSYAGCRPMGEFLHEAYGKKVYTIGFAAHHGAKGTPFWGPFPIPPPKPGSIEETLHRYGAPLLFVDFRKRGLFHQKLPCGPLGYNRDMVAEWPRVLDGLFFTDENAPSTVLRE